MKIKVYSCFLLAGDERIELPPKVLETPIIPFDQSPVPQDKIGIPDSNAYMFGAGVRKTFSEQWNLGVAYSLSLKDGRKSIYQTGGFGQLHLLSASLGYQF